LSGANLLPNLALDEVALDGAEVIQEQHSVEMVHFVRKDTRQQTLTLQNLFTALQVFPRDYNSIRTSNFTGKVWNAEATLFLVLLPFLVDNLWVDQRDQLTFLLSSSRVNHNQAF